MWCPQQCGKLIDGEQELSERNTKGRTQDFCLNLSGNDQMTCRFFWNRVDIGLTWGVKAQVRPPTSDGQSGGAPATQVNDITTIRLSHHCRTMSAIAAVNAHETCSQPPTFCSHDLCGQPAMNRVCARRDHHSESVTSKGFSTPQRTAGSNSRTAWGKPGAKRGSGISVDRPLHPRVMVQVFPGFLLSGLSIPQVSQANHL